MAYIRQFTVLQGRDKDRSGSKAGGRANEQTIDKDDRSGSKAGGCANEQTMEKK